VEATRAGPIPTADLKELHPRHVQLPRADTSSVLIADGYGVTLDVRDGQLVVRDGIGRHRRVRVLSRIERRIRRIVILDYAGSMFLARSGDVFRESG
jgi:hypothetical protein